MIVSTSSNQEDTTSAYIPSHKHTTRRIRVHQNAFCVVRFIIIIVNSAIIKVKGKKVISD